jgi:DICT domain-containing protein
MSAGANSPLTTSQLAERTGLSAGTLRMWESRHGFPVPARLPGGHRRYAEGDVDLVRGVLALREQGLSLAAAIERARQSPRHPAASVFAGVRRLRPDVTPAVMAKPAVLAVTRAIEDEYCARAAGGLLVGSFQRERFYRGAEHRWRELARTASLAVALADFPRRSDSPGRPVEVPVAPSHALAREWAVVISADELQACLAAWEQPADVRPPDAGRRFEVLWSLDPAVVADAVEVLAELLDAVDPVTAGRIRDARVRAPLAEGRLPDRGGELAQRMVGYLGSIIA